MAVFWRIMKSSSESVGNSGRDSTGFKEYPALFLKGFGMGTADVIPGVSGGTIALIAGVYDRLLAAIRSFDGTAIRAALTLQVASVFERVHWKFLIALVSGIASAILFFTKLVPLPLLIYTHPEPVYGLFFGLISGSVLVLLRKFLPLDGLVLAATALGAVIGYVVVTLVPVETPSDLPFIFIYGMVAIIAMILPGISGSFILLILRKYDYILGSIGRLGGSETLDALVILAVFGFGAITGLAVFSRFLGWLLKRFYRATMAMLVGFLIGTLWIIWPWQERTYEEVIKRREVQVGDAKWVAAESAPANTNLPEYYRALIVDGKPVLEKVSKKLISSTPMAPRAEDGFLPWLLMGAGLSVVLLLEWKSTSKNS
jgi:putative membrane protein